MEHFDWTLKYNKVFSFIIPHFTSTVYKLLEREIITQNRNTLWHWDWYSKSPVSKIDNTFIGLMVNIGVLFYNVETDI